MILLLYLIVHYTILRLVKIYNNVGFIQKLIYVLYLMRILEIANNNIHKNIVYSLIRRCVIGIKMIKYVEKLKKNKVIMFVKMQINLDV